MSEVVAVELKIHVEPNMICKINWNYSF